MKAKGRRIAIVSGLLAVVVLAFSVYLGWQHIVFRYRFEYLWLNAQGYPEYKHRLTGIVMVRLPGGEFLIGAQKTDPNGRNYDPEAVDAGELSESPVHEVTLRSFLIGKYEVMHGQWRQAMKSAPKAGEDFPETGVSWEDIQEFEAKTGLSLPTEAMWEYACRATSTTPFSGTGKLDDMGWFNENSGRTPHAVGQKAPNGFGLCDTHGNVWEWCEDVYDATFYAKPEAGGPEPVATSGSGNRVMRGGAWDSPADHCRSARRGWRNPSERWGYLGFRAAYRLP